VLLVALALAGQGCDGPRNVQIPLGNESLAGVYWEPRERMSPAVLLLPMLGHGKEEWLPLATRLHAEGYGVLALDLREGGRTDRERLLADTRAGFSFLREQKKIDAARIGLVGASLGANTALNFAAAEPMVRVAALLSPGLNHLGVTTEPALRDYGTRPLLLVGAEEDLSSAGAVRRLAEEARGNTVVKMYSGGAHGTDLLTAVPPAVEDVLAFLQAHL